MGKRTLLCEQSQVTLRHRRFEFANGTRFYALDKGRELHSGYQMNPEAFETVRDDALARSYARATELSFYRARTKLSRRAVGSILRGGRNAEEDRLAGRARPVRAWLGRRRRSRGEGAVHDSRRRLVGAAARPHGSH